MNKSENVDGEEKRLQGLWLEAKEMGSQQKNSRKSSQSIQKRTYWKPREEVLRVRTCHMLLLGQAG